MEKKGLAGLTCGLLLIFGLAEMVLPSFFPSVAWAGISDGLVAYYCFDDASNMGNDCSGNANHGTVVGGSVTSAAGFKGEAAVFGGYYNPAAIHVPNSNSLQFGQEFSVAFAVKMAGFNGMDGWGGYGDLGAHAAVAKSHDRIGMALLVFAGNAQGNVYSGNASYEWSASASGIGEIAPASGVGKWVHFTYTFSNTQHTAKLYANGVLIATNNAFNQSFDSINGEDLYLGKFSDSWYPLNGILDEIRIYNRALSEAEIQELYKQAATPVIDSVTPSQSTIGKPTIFEVRGNNLSPTMGFTVSDCAYSNTALLGGTSELQKFVCTQFGLEGKKQGIIKTSPGGKTLYNFEVTAMPSESQQAAFISGTIKIGNRPAGNIVIYPSSDIDSCKSAINGSFKCQVPANWSGTLTPFAKSVKFSPSLITVTNANGEQILTTPIIGMTTDSFPINGVMGPEWRKLTTDVATWGLSMSNGEETDLNAYEGRFSFKSAKISANQTAGIQTDVTVSKASEIVFARRVSSNPSHGKLILLIDGKVKAAWSGNRPWSMVRFPIAAGTHTLRWEYKKDSAEASGADAAWIDALDIQVSTQVAGVSCDGIPPGTIKQMSIQNPTCQQARNYAVWSRIGRPYLIGKANQYINTINSIDTAHTWTKNTIDLGGRIYGYLLSPLSSGLITPEAIFDIGMQLSSDAFGIPCGAIESPVSQSVCKTGETAALAAVEYGIKSAANGTLGAVTITPYAIESSLSIYFDLAYAYNLDGQTEGINSINISINMLDEYYKGGMRAKALCNKYGVTCSSLTSGLDVLIDPFANSHGYENSFFGSEYNKEKIKGHVNDSGSINLMLLKALQGN